MDGIIQQFGLVSCHIKLQTGVCLLQASHNIRYSLLQITHLGITLLDDSQRNTILPIMAHKILSQCRTLFYLAQILQLQQSAGMLDIDVAHIINSQYLTVKMDIVTIYAIHYRQRSQLDVVVSQSTLQVLNRQSQCLHLFLLRNTPNLGRDHAAHIHHSHRRQLLQSSASYIGGKITQLGKLRGSLAPCTLILYGYIQIKSRNIHGTSLNDFRAFHLLRQMNHRQIYLFIYLDKEHVHVGTGLKLHQDTSLPHARIGVDALHTSYTRQVQAQGGNNLLLHLLG